LTKGKKGRQTGNRLAAWQFGKRRKISKSYLNTRSVYTTKTAAADFSVG